MTLRKTTSVAPDRRHVAHGPVEAKQHVDLHRKVLMRRNLLRIGVPGAAYVPYCGDGDIAIELYRGRRVFAADIDPNRTAVAASNLPEADIRTADCDEWPFPGLENEIAIADFDAYGYPYTAFRAFWANARKANRLALFFTDGQGLNIEWKGRWNEPTGELVTAPGFVQSKDGGDLLYRRRTWSFWFSQHLWPWLITQISPEWRPIHRFRYIRGIMVYWGAVIERV